MLTPAPTTRSRRDAARPAHARTDDGSHPGRAPTGDHGVLRSTPHVRRPGPRIGSRRPPSHRFDDGSAWRWRQRWPSSPAVAPGAAARRRPSERRQPIRSADSPCTSTPVPNTPPAASSRSRSMHRKDPPRPRCRWIRRSPAPVGRPSTRSPRCSSPTAVSNSSSPGSVPVTARLANRWSRRSTTTRRGTRRRPRRRTARAIAPVGPGSWRRMCSRSGSKTAA